MERVFIFGTTLVISSLAWAIISTVLQLDSAVTTNVAAAAAAASNKSASVVVRKQSLKYFDRRHGQLVANHSSPHHVTLHYIDKWSHSVPFVFSKLRDKTYLRFLFDSLSYVRETESLNLIGKVWRGPSCWVSLMYIIISTVNTQRILKPDA